MTAESPPRVLILSDDMFKVEDSLEKGEPSKYYGLPVPWFTIEDLAKFFFAKTKDWVRWLHRRAPGYPYGHFVLDGEPLRPKRTAKGYRAYSLADVEKMVYALHEDGRINDADKGEILGLIFAVAVRYEYLTPEDLAEISW